MNTVDSLFSEENDDDWRGLHDVVIDTLDISLTRKELKIIFKKLPNHIRFIGLEWGLMDTVFRDEAYVAIQGDPSIYDSKDNQ